MFGWLPKSNSSPSPILILCFITFSDKNISFSLLKLTNLENHKKSRHLAKVFIFVGETVLWGGLGIDSPAENWQATCFGGVYCQQANPARVLCFSSLEGLPNSIESPSVLWLPSTFYSLTVLWRAALCQTSCTTTRSTMWWRRTGSTWRRWRRSGGAWSSWQRPSPDITSTLIRSKALKHIRYHNVILSHQPLHKERHCNSSPDIGSTLIRSKALKHITYHINPYKNESILDHIILKAYVITKSKAY